MTEEQAKKAEEQPKEEAQEEKKVEKVSEAASQEETKKAEEQEAPVEEKEEEKKEDQQAKRSTAPRGVSRDQVFDKDAWQPKTQLGKLVKTDQIKDIDEIISKGTVILEAQIVDALIPNLESDLLAIGQSKGKFGGGKRSIWRQTQKKTKEGNKPSFATLAVVGNRDGFVGIGLGKAKETVPAREKAVRNAKLNLIKIRRGSGSWESATATPNSIPFAVEGKCGSVIVRLMPAPLGKGLVIEKECKKMLQLAGIKDVYSKTLGHTKTKLNLIKACFEALRKLTEVKVQQDYYKKAAITEGRL